MSNYLANGDFKDENLIETFANKKFYTLNDLIKFQNYLSISYT